MRLTEPHTSRASPSAQGGSTNKRPCTRRYLSGAAFHLAASFFPLHMCSSAETKRGQISEKMPHIPLAQKLPALSSVHTEAAARSLNGVKASVHSCPPRPVGGTCCLPPPLPAPALPVFQASCNDSRNGAKRRGNDGAGPGDEYLPADPSHVDFLPVTKTKQQRGTGSAVLPLFIMFAEAGH